MVRVFFRLSAKEDLRQAIQWYESQIPGLGRNFLEATTGIIKKLEDRPYLYQLIGCGIRRAVLRQFPYGIFYRVENDRNVEVLAVLHLGQHPSRWQRRV